MKSTVRGDLPTKLVAAALDLLESGTEDLSLRAVARAAGVSAMAPYRHFADKSALLAAVADRGFAALHDCLAAADSDPEPRAALLAQGLAYVAFARARPTLFRLMFGDQLGPAKQPPVAGDANAYDVLARRVASLVPDDAQSATLACWSVVHGLATLVLDGRLAGLDPDQERRALALFMLQLGNG